MRDPWGQYTYIKDYNTEGEHRLILLIGTLNVEFVNGGEDHRVCAFGKVATTSPYDSSSRRYVLYNDVEEKYSTRYQRRNDER